MFSFSGSTAVFLMCALKLELPSVRVSLSALNNLIGVPVIPLFNCVGVISFYNRRNALCESMVCTFFPHFAFLGCIAVLLINAVLIIVFSLNF